jgi:hypothetical protein
MHLGSKREEKLLLSNDDSSMDRKVGYFALIFERRSELLR